MSCHLAGIENEAIGSGPNARVAQDAAVAYNSQANEYLVVWHADVLAQDDEFEIFGQRLSATGAELGGDFRISNAGPEGDVARGAFSPALAYSSQANEYLVVRHGDPDVNGDNEIFGQRVSASCSTSILEARKVSCDHQGGEASRLPSLNFAARSWCSIGRLQPESGVEPLPLR
jgi:hypothetical protein